jgi:hypothetical protein
MIRVTKFTKSPSIATQGASGLINRVQFIKIKARKEEFIFRAIFRGFQGLGGTVLALVEAGIDKRHC